MFRVLKQIFGFICVEFIVYFRIMSFINEIKCNKCGRWNHWNNNIFEVCFFCGEFLDIQSIFKESKEQARITTYENNSFLIIRKNDKWPLRIVKRIFAVINLIFIALITFMVFLVSMAPG